MFRRPHIVCMEIVSGTARDVREKRVQDRVESFDVFRKIEGSVFARVVCPSPARLVRPMFERPPAMQNYRTLRRSRNLNLK